LDIELAHLAREQLHSLRVQSSPMTAFSPQPRHPELVSGSIPRFARSQRQQAQPHRKVPPLGVLGVDEVDLPLPVPPLELLLAQDRGLHLAEHLEVDEAVDPVAAGEAREQSLAVLHQALDQVRRDADIDRAVVPVREEINARVSLFTHAPEGAEKWTLKQVQGDEEGFDLVAIPSTASSVRHAELVSASIVPTVLWDEVP
jgi:hypothetical protein